MSVIPVVGRGPLQRSSATVTFTGAAGLGAIGTYNILTVTGEVLVIAFVPFCTTLTGVDAGTGVASMQVGVVNATTLFVGTTDATGIPTNNFWVSQTPNANGIALPAATKDIVITQNIQGQVTSTGTKLVNSGTIRFDVYWLPLSSDGLIA